MGKNDAEAIDVRFLISSLATWLLSAAVTLPLAAMFAHFCRINETSLAYLSSALSFITAFVAGAKGISIRKKNAFMTGSVCGICIVLLALTIGFVVAANSLHSDGILSVVTFTMAGSLAGGVFFYGKPKTHRTKSVPRPNRKRKERK